MKKWLKVSLWMVALSLCLLLPKQTVKASTDYNLGSLKKSGSIIVDVGEDFGEWKYIRFVAPQDGYVVFTVNGTENTRGTVDGHCFLCNAKKNRITSDDDTSLDTDSSFTYGVKKNKVYYLQVKMYAKEEYQVSYKFTKVNEKTGNHKKSKAATIKKSKTVKGLLMAGEKKADWYKIKLTQKQVLRLTVTTKSYRGIRVEVFDKYGEKVYGLDFYHPGSFNGTKTIHSAKWNGKAMKIKPGTYYVKVYTNKDSKACGYYSLKWR